MLVDTHCHIHDADYPLDALETMTRARAEGVQKLICVGTSEQSSAAALEFAAQHKDVFASIGVHPHDTKEGWGKIAELATKHQKRAVHAPSGQDTKSEAQPNKVPATSETLLARNGILTGTELNSEHYKLVAVGEIGLDYFYSHSPRDIQIQALESQIQTAIDHNLPIIFHVREAFADFWPIFDNFHGIRGELHSFTDTKANLEEGLKRGLFIGVNGISTFTKDTAQKEMFAAVPLDRLLLETDAPFLTPAPKRGTINEPAFVGLVASAQARARQMSDDELAAATTANAQALFSI